MLRSRTIGCVAVLGLAAAAFAAGPDLSVIPADSRWVVHVDVTTAMNSKLAQGLMDLALSEDSPLPAGKMAELKQTWTKMKQVRSMTIFGPSADPDKGAVVLKGSYELDEAKKVFQVNEADSTGHGTHTILTSASKPRTNVAFVSDSVVVLGPTVDAVKGALNVIDGKAGALSGESVLATMLNPTKGSFVVVAVKDVADLMKDLPRKGMQAQFAEKMRDARMELGEADGKLYGLLEMGMLTEEDAQLFQKMGEGLLAMAQLSDETPADMAKLLESVVIKRDGRVLNVGISRDVPDVLQRLKNLAEQRRQRKGEVEIEAR